MAITTHGIPADAVALLTGQQVPGNLYYELSQRAERITKAAEVILYSTVHLQETRSLFYLDNSTSAFAATIVEVFNNLK
jgi:alanyl-tRNA synthetase